MHMYVLYVRMHGDDSLAITIAMLLKEKSLFGSNVQFNAISYTIEVQLPLFPFLSTLEVISERWNRNYTLDICYSHGNCFYQSWDAMLFIYLLPYKGTGTFCFRSLLESDLKIEREWRASLQATVAEQQEQASKLQRGIESFHQMAQVRTTKLFFSWCGFLGCSTLKLGNSSL